MMSMELPAQRHNVQLKKLATALFLFNLARWTTGADDKLKLLQKGIVSLVAAFESANGDVLLSNATEAELRNVLSGTSTNAGADKIMGVFETVLGEPEQSLASYGTLRPGEENYWVMDGINGNWIEGTIHGRVVQVGRYPMFIPSSAANDAVSVLIFRSPELQQHWHRIDEFEGPNYQRILEPVKTPNGLVIANVYATPAWQKL